METGLSIALFATLVLIVFFNTILRIELDDYRSRNNGIEINTGDRLASNIYMGIIWIVLALSVIFASWWIPIVSYIVGRIISEVFYASKKDNDIIAYIIFFGKFIKPILLIIALVVIFV